MNGEAPTLPCTLQSPHCKMSRLGKHMALELLIPFSTPTSPPYTCIRLQAHLSLQ